MKEKIEGISRHAYWVIVWVLMHIFVLRRKSRRANESLAETQGGFMKELVSGQVADLGISYDAKVEDGKLKISAEADFGALISKGEAALPAGALQPFEVAILEMVKQAVKGI